MANLLILLGNIGKIGELDTTKEKPKIWFTVATRSWRKGPDGRNQSDWHMITAYGRNAELIADYVSVGDKIYVEGELGYYQKKDSKQSLPSITANRIDLIGRTERREEGGRGSPATRSKAADINPDQYLDEADEAANPTEAPDDDCPF